MVGSFYYVPFQGTKAAVSVNRYGEKKTILFSQLHNHALLRGNVNIRNEARLPSITLAPRRSGEGKTERRFLSGQLLAWRIPIKTFQRETFLYLSLHRICRGLPAKWV